MPRANQATTPVAVDIPEVTGRYAPVGDYTVSFETFHTDVDPAPFFAGLPDDRCQCPHWGYVITGKLTMRFADHEEVFEAGDAWYAPPGHAPVKHEPGTEIVQFSPTQQLAETEAAMARNMQAMQHH
jgi:hypothetical protein